MKITERQIKTIAVVVGVISAVTAVIVYLDNKKWRKANSEVVELDKQIKKLQLEKLEKTSLVMDFYKELAEAIKTDKELGANNVVMLELGKSIGDDKQNFITVMTNAQIEVDDNAEDIELVDEFIKNASENDELLINAAIYLGEKNKTLNANGEAQLSDAGVKATHRVMRSYFCGGGYSNAAGEIATAIGQLGQAAGTIVGGSQQLQAQRKYGAQMSYDKNREARSQMLQGIAQSKQAQIDAKAKEKEQKSKNIRTALLVGGGVVALLSIVGIVIYLKKRKK